MRVGLRKKARKPSARGPDEGSRWAAALAIAEAHWRAGQNQASPSARFRASASAPRSPNHPRPGRGTLWTRSVPVESERTSEPCHPALGGTGPSLFPWQPTPSTRNSLAHLWAPIRHQRKPTALRMKRQPKLPRQPRGGGRPHHAHAWPDHARGRRAARGGGRRANSRSHENGTHAPRPFPGIVTQLAITSGQQVVEGTLLVLERQEEVKP